MPSGTGGIPLDGSGAPDSAMSGSGARLVVLAPFLPVSLALVLIGAACGPAPPVPPDGGMVMDGRFEDWEVLPPLLEDPVDAFAETPADLRRVWVSNDPAWLYLSLEVTGVLNIQAMRGTIHLVIDADGDAGTGGEAFGLEGADWVLDLSRQDRPQPGGYGAGFALRPVSGEGIGAPGSAYDARATGVPTHASSRFELRLAREPPAWAEGYRGLGPVIRARWVSTRDGRLLDETEVFSSEFAGPPGPDPTLVHPARIRRVPGALRVAHWNVAEGRFRVPHRHAAVLGALKPDVILLDEVYEEVDSGALSEFFSLPGLGESGEWSFVVSQGGGRQKTVVAARGLAIRQEPSMTRVDYDLSDHDRLGEARGSGVEEFQRREGEIGKSSTGAWLEFDGLEVLLVPFDLQSAGYLDSPQDRLRLVQAETLARHVRMALEARPEGALPAAVILGGDLNLVGGTAPLQHLVTGSSPSELDLQVAVLPRLGTGAHTTWRDSRRGPFAPGILDMSLFSRDALEQAGGFVFATEDLDDQALRELGLEREASALASDHLVLVTDLRLKAGT